MGCSCSSSKKVSQPVKKVNASNYTVSKMSGRTGVRRVIKRPVR